MKIRVETKSGNERTFAGTGHSVEIHTDGFLTVYLDGHAIQTFKLGDVKRAFVSCPNGRFTIYERSW